MVIYEHYSQLIAELDQPKYAQQSIPDIYGLVTQIRNLSGSNLNWGSARIQRNFIVHKFPRQTSLWANAWGARPALYVRWTGSILALIVNEPLQLHPHYK